MKKSNLTLLQDIQILLSENTNKRLLNELNDKVTVTSKKTGNTYQISKNWYDSHASNYNIAGTASTKKPEISPSMPAVNIGSKSSLGGKKGSKSVAPVGKLVNPQPYKSGIWGANFYEDGNGTSVTVGKLPDGKYISPDRIQRKQHSLALALKRQLKTKVLLRKSSIYIPGFTGKEIQKAMANIDKEKEETERFYKKQQKYYKFRDKMHDVVSIARDLLNLPTKL